MFWVGNCNIHAEQKISLINETKWYKILPGLKGRVQIIFPSLLPNFVLQKVGLNLVNFAWTKVTEMKLRLIYTQKGLSLPRIKIQ